MDRITKFQFYFNSDKIDITDPCYDRDVWCRMSVKIVPGEYTVFVEEKEYSDWGRRIASLTIANTKNFSYTSGDEMVSVVMNKGDVVGEIGVDAGLAGFFIDKPDFSDEEWSDLCDRYFFDSDWGDIVYVSSGEAQQGVWSRSGFGDGGYNVYGIKNNQGKYTALQIRFI